MAQKKVDVALEIGSKRTFAAALAWPGWCRGGQHEQAALDALLQYLPRYQAVGRRAQLPVPADELDLHVVQRLAGSATTDFGAPGEIADAEHEPVTTAAATNLAGWASACWAAFDETVAHAPAELRKGPRGGGRDRDKMVDHVIAAEWSYSRKLGIKLPQPAMDDLAGVEALREAISAVLTVANDGRPLIPNGWPTRYAARRICWHVLDHAWEMQDRNPNNPSADN